MLCYAYFNQKSLRSIPNTYIISLSFGDLLAICVALPFVSTIYTVESWPYGTFVCKLSELIRDLSTAVSVYTLTILSFDRYVAIVCPFQRYASKRRKTTLFNTLCIWTVSFLIALPGFLTSHLKWFNVANDKEISVCYPFPEEYGDIYPKIVVLAKFLFLYFIPLMFIKVFYLAIARHLLKSLKSFKTSNVSDAHLRNIQKRTKVAKMVLMMIVIFALCFFPSHIFLLWFYFYPNAQNLYNEFWHYLRIIGFVLTFTNSCLNPIALYFISGEFRKYFKMYLCTCERAVLQPNSANSVFTHQLTHEDPTRTSIAYLGNTNTHNNYLNTPTNHAAFHNQLSLNSSNNISFSAPKFRCCSKWNSSASYDDSDHAIEMMLNATGVFNNQTKQPTQSTTSSDSFKRKRLNSKNSIGSR